MTTRPVSVGGRGDAVAAVDVDGERLLDEHVPPGSQSLDGEGGVRPRGCGDDDDVDVAIGEEPVEVGRRSRPTGGRRRGERRGRASCRRRRPARRRGARRWRRRGTCRTPRTRGVRAGAGHRRRVLTSGSARGAPHRCCCRPCRRTRSRGRRSSAIAVGNTTLGTVPTRSSTVSGSRSGSAVRAMTRDGSSGSSSIAPARYTSEPCWDGSKPGATSPWTPWWMSSQPSGTRMGGGPAADLGALVGMLGQGDAPVVPHEGERSDVGFDLVGGHVGDPDAGPIVGEAGRQPGRCRVEPGHGLVPHRAVQHGVARDAVGAGDRLREDHRVLVGVQVEVDVQPGLVARTARGRAAPTCRGRATRPARSADRAGRTRHRS